MSFVSGLNAIAHAAEGGYAQDGNPVMSLMAEEGIRAIAIGGQATVAGFGLPLPVHHGTIFFMNRFHIKSIITATNGLAE